MPCIKCSNGKWKYGARGNCQFDTEKQCHEAEAAIHIQENQSHHKQDEHLSLLEVYFKVNNSYRKP
jgi:hypothetical protein